MMFEGLSATADVVGRRLIVTWTYALDALETPGDVPNVTLRRKERDFDFPPVVAPDPYLVYDSTTFPPAPVPGSIVVIDLPSSETVEDGLRVRHVGISVSHVISGVPHEVLRRTVHTTLGVDAAPIKVRVELLDAGALTPRTAYYYELNDGSAPSPEDLERYHAVAVAGGTHGVNRRMYDMVPEVYKRHDVRVMSPADQFPGIPETSGAGGQLRRFVDVFGIGIDAMRSSAENLLDLHDPFRTEGRFVPALSRMIGWEPTNIYGVALQRNELLTATRLFDVVGTIPAMRALVTYQTGWHSQLTEFAQHVVRANEPARRSVYAMEERPALPSPVWQGVDDATRVFQFPDGGSTGSGVLPAVLTSAQVEPFALRPGMELTIIVDGGVPARVRFGPDDFADIGAATAAEVAEAISAVFDTLIATGVAGAVELRTHAVGPKASVEVIAAATSLVALTDAPAGAVSAFVDPTARLRVFYEQKRDPGRTEWAALAGQRISTIDEIGPQPRSIRYKSWGYSEWHDERDVPSWTGDPTSPFATPLPDGRVWLTWLDTSRDPSSRLSYAVGTAAAAMPAVITSHRGEPFALTPGTQLTITGAFGVELFTVNAVDYALPAAATAAEVVAAMNTQFAQVNASVVAGGAIRLATAATGPDVTIAVDLAQSTAARRLGLESRRLMGRGSWNTAIDWVGARRGRTHWGPMADPSAVRDPLGGVRLFWSEHQRARWEIRQAHWSERLTIATATGAAQRTTGAWQQWHIADGLPSDDVRALAVDANGTVWFATAAGLASRRPDNTWAVLTTVDGLSSNDVRDVAFLPDGTLWCATPAGVSELLPSGVFNVITTTPTTLVSNDVRAVVCDGFGNAWAATPAGVSQRSTAGLWRTWTTADGISSGVPRSIAVGAGSRVALATAAGVSVRLDETWVTHTIAQGLPSDDIRAVAWDALDDLVVGTAAGIAIWNGRTWRTLSAANGLPSNDVRSVAYAPDGNLIVGTALGIAIGRENTWSIQTAADGLPSNVISAIHTTWSAPLILAQGVGGHREPHACVDTTDRTWLVWARRDNTVATSADTWTLRFRRFDPAAAVWTWEVEQAATTSPGGTADREPCVQPQGAGVRVFFSSDRAGGRSIWWVDISGLGVPGVPGSLPNDAAETTAPAVVTGPTGLTWMFHRSDRSIVPSQVGVLPLLGTAPRPSARVPDAGALRLHAGSRTPVLLHAARNLGRRTWNDLFTYTPEYPNLVSDDAPADDHLYTRRTVGLYLRPGRTGHVVTEEQVKRLLQLLRRFLPINLRLVLIVAPEAHVEFVYTPEADITDAFQDQVPLAEVLGGLSDAFDVMSPDIAAFLSNELASRTASVADLTTLRRRTWFPDLV